jgi:hypothetical protein
MSKQRQKQRLFLLIAFVIVTYAASFYQPDDKQAESKDWQEVAESLYENKQSDVQTEMTGKVIRLLKDDLKGSKHQRFIIELPVGQTILVAHNIDLAPRIDALEVGDEVTVYGEYEWNKKGGVMHWTHHDPANKHPHGWIKHQGKTYQ